MEKLVFVVEDDEVQQKILKHYFTQLDGNYVVRPFVNPEDLYNNLSEKPYAVVLDHFFAGTSKTGVDYLKVIKKQHSKVPVIYYTALTDEKITKEVMDLGAEQYIIKDSASLIRLRTALDVIHDKKNRKSFFQKLFRSN
ncbi:MAG: response regulator [Cyclobacteriaceae bacterium]